MHEYPLHYYCGKAALDELIQFCQQGQLNRFILVSDTNTHGVLGERTAVALQAQGWQVKTIVLEGQEIVADEKYLDYVLARSEGPPWIFLAVGSGTITDIVRYCSKEKCVPFISLPTAPSVDGFASVVAPIVVKGYKATVLAQTPIAIFADLPTLCNAPKPMIAAGLGDMLGKYTALADWELDHLLWEQPYQIEIAARMERALMACVDNIEGIRSADEQGISHLMDGLVEAGICMTMAGNSRPASGAEHHLSHYWEMKLLRQNRPAILHGAKVGVGSVLIAKRWEQILSLNPEEMQQRLCDSKLPSIEQERLAIEAAFPLNTNLALKSQMRFLELSEADFAALKEKISYHWGTICEIAGSVPPVWWITELLKRVSAPTDVVGLGLDQQDEDEALRYAHYLRDQFTVIKLGRIIGLWE